MAEDDLHFESFSLVTSNMHVNVHMKALSKKMQKAQFALDTQIMSSMVPFMPRNTATLINTTLARSMARAGTGVVCAAAPPYGRFQYYGKVMVDPATNSPWARKGAKKITTDRPLNYSNPKAQPEWFEVAKERDVQKWVQKVKQALGGQ